MFTVAARKGLDWGMEEKNGIRETSWKTVQARSMVLGPEGQDSIGVREMSGSNIELIDLQRGNMGQQ